jgi:hypothetical protein
MEFNFSHLFIAKLYKEKYVLRYEVSTEPWLEILNGEYTWSVEDSELGSRPKP